MIVQEVPVIKYDVNDLGHTPACDTLVFTVLKSTELWVFY